MEVIIAGTPHIPIAAAAEELKTTHPRILLLIRQNVMKGCQVDGEWYVEKSTLGCFRSHDGDGVQGGCRASCNGCKEK